MLIQTHDGDIRIEAPGLRLDNSKAEDAKTSMFFTGMSYLISAFIKSDFHTKQVYIEEIAKALFRASQRLGIS